VTRYALVIITAFVGALATTPLARRIAVRVGVVDQPAARKFHARPTPLLGGVAVYAAFIVALLAFGERFYIREAVGILVGATFCSLLGLVDDRQAIGARAKLVGQLAAAGILMLSGVRVQLPIPTLANLAITALWVVGITNSLNLLDNMDGLSGGVAAVASAFFLLMAAMSGQYLVGVLAAALLGACLGFLRYNVNPASIFMGDAGSLFIGFMLAAVGIKLRFPANVSFVTWMVPVMTLGLPILDTSLVTVSRLRRGLNPLTTPGKDHLSHRLVRLGYTPREAVLILTLWAGAFGLLAVFLTQASVPEGYGLGGLTLLVCLYAIWWFEKVPLEEPSAVQAAPASTSAASGAHS